MLGTWSSATHFKKVSPRKKPAQDVAPEQMPALPHVGEVNRPTSKQTADILRMKGLTHDDLVRIREMSKEAAIPVPDGAAKMWITPKGVPDQLPLTYCTIYVHDQATCCYYFPAAESPLWGWNDPVFIKVWQDPQYNTEMSACGYPIYPFEVNQAEFRLYVPDTCTIVASFDIQDFVWDHCTPYPGEIIAQTDTLIFEITGPGFPLLVATFDPPVCVYDRFFAGFTFYNTKDFDPTCYVGDPVIPCTLETVNGDTTWGTYSTEVPYHFVLSAIYDQAGTYGRTYWSYDAYPDSGIWWDGLDWWPGAVRLQASGYTADQNPCPRFESWWQKETFLDTGTVNDTFTVFAYAPCGIPDFDQKINEETNPTKGPFDGPTAVANCLWWMAAAEIIRPFWNDSNEDTDNWDPAEPPNLIDSLTTYMNLTDCGVTPEQMNSVLAQIHDNYILWFTHTELQAPTWEEIEYNLRLSQDVILLLGFWYIDSIIGEPPETTWARIGGHWVTAAGVEHAYYVDLPDTMGILKISDPDLDAVEFATSPWGCDTCANGIYMPHDPAPHPEMVSIHFDAGNTSYDCYAVAPSSSPGGLVRLVGYPVRWGEGSGDSLNLYKYEDHNLKLEFEQFQGPVPQEGTEIIVEIEYAKILIQEPKHHDELIQSSRFEVGLSNEGNVGTGVTWYHPNGIDTIQAGFDGSIILGDTIPDNLANSSFISYYVPKCSRFLPVMWWELDTLRFERTVPDTNPVVYKFPRHYTRFVHQTLPLEVEVYAVGASDPEEDPCGDAIFINYVITNTGDASIDAVQKALFVDFDIYTEYFDTNMVDTSCYFSTIWAYYVNVPNILFGMTQMPVFQGGGACGAFGVNEPYWIYPKRGWDCDTLMAILEASPCTPDSLLHEPTDIGVMLIDCPFNLAPSERYANQYLIWAYDKNDPVDSLGFGEFLYELLRRAGYYRGDVNDDGKMDISDVVYLINYLLKGGAAPLPFNDQADVNGDGRRDVSDAVYMILYLLKGKAAPIDKNRFLPPEYQQIFNRTGLVGDDVWRDLPNLTLP